MAPNRWSHAACLALARRTAILAGLALALGSIAASAVELEPFFGAFVGVATLEDSDSGEVRERDMDIVIKPFRRGGFEVHWVNVTLVDGRRDLPGVERRVQTVLFEPADDGNFYVEVEEDNPFRERAETRPMRGDPVRWASLDDQGLHVYSFVVLEDGRYEIQIYDRVLTDAGIDINFRRILDGAVVRRVTGSTARANIKVPASDD